MGLFSSKNIITVSSTVYNMAGDEKDRPDYLKSLIARNVLSGTKDTIGETLNKGYLKGPAMKLRSFFHWAERNYGVIGIPTGSLNSLKAIDSTILGNNIPHASGTSVWIQKASGGRADYSYWIEQWLFTNRLSQVNDEYVADIAPTTNLITINFTNGQTVSFNPVGYDVNAKYIYAYYNEVNDTDQAGTPIPGPVIPTGSSIVDTTGWLFESTVRNDTVPVTLTRTERTVVSYSDGRPSETSERKTTSQSSYIYKSQRYTRDTETGDGTNPDRDTLNKTHEIMLVNEKKKIFSQTQTFTDEYMVGAVKVTQTTYITDESLTGDNDYQITRQNIVSKEWSPLKLFIYKLGSGNPALDAALDAGQTKGEFFPVIPVRLANQMLSEQNFGAAFQQATKAYKKATGSQYKDLQKKLDTNENIKDIDSAYVVFGVSLNVIEPSCRRYVWEFINDLMDSQTSGTAAYQEWRQQNDAYAEAFENWKKWRDKQSAGSSSNVTPTPEPKLPTTSSTPENRLVIGPSTAVETWYEISLSWNYIRKESGTGLGKPGAKKGEIWFQKSSISMYQTNMYIGIGPNQNDQTQGGIVNVPVTRIYRQVSDNSYEFMEMMGFKHSNHIYDTKSVVITAEEAIDDPDESGFIIPLNYETYRSTSLIDSSQMATASVFLVLNCYTIVKQRWYERGLFKILFVVAIAIASVVFTGGAGIGILGAHMAVGGALGLTGMTAAIVGSIANALAALVLSTIIEKLAVGILGDALGSIVASVIGIVMGSGAFSGGAGSFSMNWSTLFKPENIIKMTSAVGDGIARGIIGNIRDMADETTQFLKTTKEKTDNVAQAFMDSFGYGGGQINPLMFIDASKATRYESRDTFLSRTLMTGTDIANMSNNMITDYVGISTQLETAFV